MSRARDTADQINRVNSSAADATAITVDSSENVMVGVASVQTQSGTTAGTSLYGGDNAGLITAGRNGDILRLNRQSSNGDIALFKKDGTTVGSIAVDPSSIGIGSGDTGIFFNSGDDALIPVGNGGSLLSSRDNAIDLGRTNARFKDAYIGGGVYLGGVGSANKLEDYEEGSWTPTVGGNAAYSIQTGSYTKVGNLVFIYGEIIISSMGTGTVNFISGLPFNGNREHTINISKFVNSTTSVYYANLRTSGASLYLAYQNDLDGTWTNNPSFLTTSTHIQFSGTYLTDS